MVAVRQKAQPMAHPTCVDTHSVRRPSSGMYTASTCFPSGVRRRSLTVPSPERCVRSISSVVTEASFASLSRKALGRSVISSSERA